MTIRPDDVSLHVELGKITSPLGGQLMSLSISATPGRPEMLTVFTIEGKRDVCLSFQGEQQIEQFFQMIEQAQEKWITLKGDGTLNGPTSRPINTAMGNIIEQRDKSFELAVEDVLRLKK